MKIIHYLCGRKSPGLACLAEAITTQMSRIANAIQSQWFLNPNGHLQKALDSETVSNLTGHAAPAGAKAGSAHLLSCRLALGQTQPERCRLADPGALTLGHHVLRHGAALVRHLHHYPPLHCAPGSLPSQRPLGVTP